MIKFVKKSKYQIKILGIQFYKIKLFENLIDQNKLNKNLFPKN